MFLAFGHNRGFHNYAHHAHGVNRALELRSAAKILVMMLAVVLAIVARYIVLQWGEREYGDAVRANGLSWLVFILVLVIVGSAGLAL
jgi:hypothetical protein